MISIKFKVDTYPGRLARAEVHFLDGELQGLKLTGFRVWADRTVTFPGQTNALGHSHLQPISATAHPTLQQEILAAYDEFAQASGLTHR